MHAFLNQILKSTLSELQYNTGKWSSFLIGQAIEGFDMLSQERQRVYKCQSE
jgi:hypothetical protein